MRKVFVISLLLTALCAAQEGSTGSLAGVVIQQTGAVVSGVKITITSANGNKADLAGPDGHFLFSLLRPGSYSIRLERAGYKAAETKTVEVIAGKGTTTRILLRDGDPSETVASARSGTPRLF